MLEVNAYVTRIALDLNAVMEELCVFANEPGMNEEIMQGIVARVCEEVNRLFFVAPGFNANGVLQVKALPFTSALPLFWENTDKTFHFCVQIHWTRQPTTIIPNIIHKKREKKVKKNNQKIKNF